MSDTTKMEVMVGSVSAGHFKEPHFGAALLASQFRDSFFEVQEEIAGPVLALINKYRAPTSLFECPPPPKEKDLSSNGVTSYMLTILTAEDSPESLKILKGLWDTAAIECDDLVGGIFTMEHGKDEAASLIQVIKVSDWSQVRRHPFLRGADGRLHAGTPIVEDNDDGGEVDISEIMGR